ncbi:DUF305 domain-containing protein [Streptosporangium sp. NPDC001559]|uniref:DUF305 domain-containing protein n=1 Tax=Streptosporangium sp. NPDC001559 TaxID=3366187 RepID=UPI0036F159D2
MATPSFPARHVGLAALGVSAVLTACGGPGDLHAALVGPRINAPAVSSTGVLAEEHNAQDVRFAQEMILHHRQTLIMTGMAGTHTSNAQVRALAEQIGRAEEAEITQLTAWLRSWGEPAPGLGPCMTGPPGGRDDERRPCNRGPEDMGPGMHRGPHMMGWADLESLDEASGTDFDRTFLDMMVRHHTDAMGLAAAEQRDGRSPNATALAASIITRQTAEIVQMRSMLARP